MTCKKKVHIHQVTKSENRHEHSVWRLFICGVFWNTYNFQDQQSQSTDRSETGRGSLTLELKERCLSIASSELQRILLMDDSGVKYELDSHPNVREGYTSQGFWWQEGWVKQIKSGYFYFGFVLLWEKAILSLYFILINLRAYCGWGETSILLLTYSWNWWKLGFWCIRVFWNGNASYKSLPVYSLS